MKDAKEELDKKTNHDRLNPLWKQLDQAGRDAQAAGESVSNMAAVANPFLPDSEWTYPRNHPQAPNPPYSRYMPAHPTYQKWLTDNAWQLNTPGPTASSVGGT